MKILKTTTVLAMASVLCMAASAGASMHASHGSKKAVTTLSGNAVMTQFNNCVITQWDSAGGECSTFETEQRTVYFDFNSSSLTPAAKTKLSALAKDLKSSKVAAVKIVGFADEIGTDSYNLRLSEKRANAVAAYLRGKGIKVSGKSEVRGLGATSSQSSCADQTGKKALQACLWRDRRVEVEIVN